MDIPKILRNMATMLEGMDMIAGAGKCAKQPVIAVIKTTKDEYFFGLNSCRKPQEVCPRGDMPSGEGYEMCKEICDQTGHAEVNACQDAGDAAGGATLYLIGHTYCCDHCKKIMDEHGIETTVICESPESIESIFEDM